MNIPVTASKLIDRAILLEEGGAIIIPCSSYEEMEKLRIRLYKLKGQLQKSCRDTALSLDIKRKVSTDRWTIFITKDVGLPGVFVVEGGEAKPFEVEEVEEVEPPKLPEEPFTLEQIKTYKPFLLEKKEIPSSEADFDDIALEIEKTQGLVEEKEDINNV